MSGGFTPGPWSADGHRFMSDGTVTMIWLNATTSIGTTNLADAHLAAAAPDLFEAAERALNYITNTEGEFGVLLECGDLLRAALAKARGSITSPIDARIEGEER